jgi:type I restriction enzyme S subunit
MQIGTIQQQLDAKTTDTVRKFLSLTNMKITAIPLPPAHEQRRIVAEVERRFSLADVLEETMDTGFRRAERLRQAILKRAFEGRLVPQDPEDEPAEVLLERIRAQREGRKTRRTDKTAQQMRLPNL